jgi:xanthine dehydrogenase YagS FAD-binding subunit
MHPFQYSRASSLGQAHLAGGEPNVRFLAGGTTLFDLMKLDIERPERIVDINFLDLSDVVVTDDEIVLGATVRMAQAAELPVIVEEFPALSEALWRAASQQLRNMASLGGNLLQRTRCHYFRHGAPYACNKREPGSGCAALEGANRGHAILGATEGCIAAYPGDFGAALAAFDARIDISGPDGERTIDFGDLHLRPEDPAVETSLQPGELITAIRIPRNPVGRASTYLKIRDRESYAFALTSCCAALRMDGDVVAESRISLGGLATVPWRAPEAERFLVGQRFTPEVALAAGELAFAGARTSQQNAFKIELGARTVADALTTAYGRV